MTDTNAESPLTDKSPVIETLTGAAKVLDGDTLVIGQISIRLFGIDAPESAQTCLRDKKPWRCGDTSAKELAKLIRNQKIVCKGSEHDRYGRLIAVCIAGQIDINAVMVRYGYAVAYHRYTDEYATEEQHARHHKLGIWNSEFEVPATFRQTRWRKSRPARKTNDCPIKGNINRKGERIYHTPWSKHYKRTRISKRKGEKWFCSEQEALDAGFRPARYY